nr:accessory Sec system protein Asp3 [Staphylococcus delphini]
MYGSILRFKPTETLFENELMPSGIVIHEWKMITAYDEESLVPALPILKKIKPIILNSNMKLNLQALSILKSFLNAAMVRFVILRLLRVMKKMS